MSRIGRDFDEAQLDAIRDGLRANVEALALALWGQPSAKHGPQWRWGRKGSRRLDVRGAKRGLWVDEEDSAGGDLFRLIERERACDFSGAVAFARDFLGGAISVVPRLRPADDRAARKAEAAADDAQRRAFARRLWGEAVPIGRTVAERYLVETRRIPQPAAGWPEALRFHAGRCALTLAATLADGAVAAVQLVHLTPDAQKRPAEDDRPTKQSFGPQQGAAVRLPGRGPELLLAEGPETSLAIWASTGRETWAALGSIGKVEPPAGRRLVVACDDDKRDAPSVHALRRRVEIWRREGWQVVPALPWTPRRFDKSDFADLIRKAGPEAVQARIEGAIAPPPPPEPPGAKAVPLAEARQQMGQVVRQFFDAATDYDPDLPAGLMPVQGVRISVGGGKSATARAEAARFLAALRRRGDKRAVAFSVPTHSLGAEAAAAFDALPEALAAGLRAAVWRGREAMDPEALGKTMCQNLQAVRDAQAVGATPVDRFACRDDKTEAECPFFRACGYQRQKRQRADLWISAHENLFHAKPDAFGKLAAVVVDETAWPAGLEGVSGPPVELSLDAFGSDVDVPGHPDESARLREVHRLVREALATHPLGPLSRQHMLDAGLTDDTGHDGRALSWQRIQKPPIFPGMPPEDRREALSGYAGARTVIRTAKAFGALEALLRADGPAFSGWLSLAEKETPDGPVRVLRIRSRRAVAKGWHVPTLLTDATLQPELARFHWPALEMAADIEVETPHMRVRQLAGRDVTKAALIPDERASPAENRRRLANSQDLRAALFREARATPGRVLVVAQKAAEDHWRSLGSMPGNMEMAHHNAVAGRDEWRDVARLIVAGRTLPRPADVERMAAALTGRAVAETVERYSREQVVVHLIDGGTVTTEADRHPDPIAEAIRWGVCEGELVQIIGRGRGVTRTSANPLEVLVLTDRPLPLPVAATIRWDELTPSPADLMMAAEAVALDSPTDAATAFPGLWPSPAAAKMAFGRSHRVTAPNKRLSIGRCYPVSRATYQKAGARQRPATLTFDPALVPDLRAWLEAKLGPLAKLEVQEPPPEPAASRAEILKPKPLDPIIREWMASTAAWLPMNSAGWAECST